MEGIGFECDLGSAVLSLFLTQAITGFRMSSWPRKPPGWFNKHWMWLWVTTGFQLERPLRELVIISLLSLRSAKWDPQKEFSLKSCWQLLPKSFPPICLYTAITMLGSRWTVKKREPDPEKYILFVSCFIACITHNSMRLPTVCLEIWVYCAGSG